MALRQHILTRDKGLCQACLPDRVTEAKQVDHIEPLHKGGTNDPSNLRSLCMDCHNTKTRKDMGHRPQSPTTAEWLA